MNVLDYFKPEHPTHSGRTEPMEKVTHDSPHPEPEEYVPTVFDELNELEEYFNGICVAIAEEIEHDSNLESDVESLRIAIRRVRAFVETAAFVTVR